MVLPALFYLLCLLSATALAHLDRRAGRDLALLHRRFEIQVHLSVMGTGVITKNTAVHETLSRAALYLGAGVGKADGAIADSGNEVREVVRGAFWNDDPACNLFDDSAGKNLQHSSGLTWTKNFMLGKKSATISPTNIIARSHFGDLQFLHAMGSEVNEAPQKTQADILRWAESLYEVSIGHLGGKTALASAPGFKAYFNAQTSPKATATVFDLLTCSTKYEHADVRYRARGSVLPILQDSYAKGHPQRPLLNPEDLQPGSKSEFKPGTFAKLGAIENFHCYKGQSAEHAHYDNWAPKFKPMEVANRESFDQLYGARMAAEAGIKLVDLWKKQTPWAGGASAFFETIFKLSPKATHSDNTV